MRKPFRLAVLAGVIAVAAGCVTSNDQLKEDSAGLIGCDPDDIDISPPQGIAHGVMWTATCKGTQYLCTLVSSEEKSSKTSCDPTR
jgi:hypothetical protein